MATSLRHSLLSISVRAATSDSLAPIERQFGRLRLGPAYGAPIAISDRVRAVTGARHSSSLRQSFTRLSSSNKESDDPIMEELGLSKGVADDSLAMDNVIDTLKTGDDDKGAGRVAVDEGGDTELMRTQIRGAARAFPASPSYFSRQPRFTDQYLRLHDLFRRYGNLPLLPSDQVERVAWKTLQHCQQETGEVVRTPLYNKSLAIVKHLHKIHPQLKPPAVVEALTAFMRSADPFNNVPRLITIDRFGRALGVGRRKTSVARAWVVEGTGEVIVNGKSLSDAFGRVHDRDSATWALRATDRADKYNVWALVVGGGTTGQAEALTLAVAKGLVAHEPALKTSLRKAGCITRDPRMVERKKTGHDKARKMPAWVKR